MSYFEKYTKVFTHIMRSVEASCSEGQNLNWLENLSELTEECKAHQGRFFFAGNGASAAFASHMSLDWSKNGGVPCIPLFDLSHLTALGNDIGYETVFSTALDWHGRSEDVLVTISSSGNSPNILKTIQVARKIGMKVVTLSGLEASNSSRKLGDINLYVPAKTYGVVECAHQLLLHIWLDYTMDIKEWDRDECQNMSAQSFNL